jgi:hypothetical protein
MFDTLEPRKLRVDEAVADMRGGALATGSASAMLPRREERVKDDKP